MRLKTGASPRSTLRAGFALIFRRSWGPTLTRSRSASRGLAPRAGRRRSLSALLALPALVSAQPSFTEVAGGLRHPDPAVRIKAIRLLKEAAYPEAVAPLAAVLTDPIDEVQLEAMEAERSLFMVEPISRRRRVGLVIEVRTENVAERAFAAGPLAVVPRLVPPEVLSGLAGAMRDNNPRVRLEALYTFGLIAPLAERASPAFREGVVWTVETLRRGDLPAQVVAARVIGRVLKGCGVMPMPAATDGSPPPCAAAGDALIDAINSHDASLRLASMAALGELRYSLAVQALTDQFNHYGRGEAAQVALEGLAGIGHASSVPLFTQLLVRTEPNLRRLALEGIARSGDRNLLPDVERIAGSDRSDVVPLAAIYALQRLGSPSRLDRLVAALAAPAVRELAQMYLIDLSASAAPALAGFLKDPSPATRAIIAEILGFSNDSSVVPSLKALLSDSDVAVSRAADRALARIRLSRP